MRQVQITSTSTKDRFFEYADMCIRGGYKFYDDDKLNLIIKTFEENNTGIVLCGNPGSGKTFVFDVLQKITHPQDVQHFAKKTCTNTVLDFNIDGDKIFKHQSLWKKNILWDDLGFERMGKFYGDKAEVMSIMLFDGYEKFIHNNIRLHFTTMMLPEEIKARYGEWFDSRLKQMCAIIALNPETDYRPLRNFTGYPQVYHAPRLSTEDVEWNRNYEEAKKQAQSKTKEPFKGVGSIMREQWEKLGPKK